MSQPVDSSNIVGDQASAAITLLARAKDDIRQQLEPVIVGQQQVIEQVLISLFCRGHCLLEGVPGLAKTLLISSISQALGMSFSRIQFTPDLMPADITGTDIIEENRTTGQRERRFLEGPLFANIILADEINRTPPKTQSALLEAMQEQQVTVGRVRHALPQPFFVLATQNPIEQEGTYSLPEAQQDRFMFKIYVDYPEFADEVEIARRTTTGSMATIRPVLNQESLVRIQQAVRLVPVSEHVLTYAVCLVRQTRVGQPGVPDHVRQSVDWGAGPRAVQFLVLGAKARALLSGRTCVSIEDIQQLAAPVLRHRLIVNFAAQSDGVSPDQVIQKIVDTTPTSEGELTRDGRFHKVLAS